MHRPQYLIDVIAPVELWRFRRKLHLRDRPIYS